MTVKDLREKLNKVPDTLTQEEFDNLEIAISDEEAYGQEGNLGFAPVKNDCARVIILNDEDAGKQYRYFAFWREV